MVSLPPFLRSRRRRQTAASGISSEKNEQPSIPYAEGGLSKSQLRQATRTRSVFASLSSFFLFISFIFLILVEIGDTHIKPALNNIWFIKLDLSQVIPISVPNASLINSVAQTLGLHDFYTVGLWGFCEGYNNVGVTSCSKPQSLYWFNPIEILLSELLNGATIAIPAQAVTYLDILRLASQCMFGLFLTGTCLVFVLIFITPLSVASRWAAFAIGSATFLAALIVTVAAILGTAIFVILKRAFTSVTELNIGATIGHEMFAFMWVAAAFAILAWLIQTSLCCCCVSRRDIRRGNEKGRTAAQRVSGIPQAAAQQGTTEARPGARRRRFLGLRG